MWSHPSASRVAAVWSGSGWPAHGVGLRSGFASEVRIVSTDDELIGAAAAGEDAEGIYMVGVTIGEFWIATIAYSCCSGLLNGTYLAIFMGLTSVRVAATQVTGYMALGNAAYAYSSLWQGRLASGHGYAAVLVLDSLIVLLPILIAPFLSPSTRGHAVLAPGAEPGT